MKFAAKTTAREFNLFRSRGRTLRGPRRTIEAKKPWLKLGMSRRTWYRRQAEKRKGR